MDDEQELVEQLQLADVSGGGFMRDPDLSALADAYAKIARKRPIDWVDRDEAAPFDTDTFTWPGDAPAAYVVRRRRHVPGGYGTELLSVHAALRQGDAIRWALADCDVHVEEAA